MNEPGLDHGAEYERVPPHDLLAEQSAVGAMLLAPSAVDELDYLTPDDFYRPAHATIVAAIRAMRARGEPVDATTIAADLLRRGEIANVGGAPYLHTLIATVPTAANADWYGRQIREHAIKRRLIKAGTRVVQLGYAADGTDIELTVERAHAEVDAVTANTASVAWLSEGLTEALEDLETPAPFTPTPWPDLNAYIDGWVPGRLYVVGARPAIGKTTVAINAATALARTGPVAVSTLEMSRREIEHRVMSSIARVPLSHFTRRTLTPADWDQLARHQAEIHGLQLAIDDNASATATDVVTHARAVARAAGGHLAGVVVDYLQIMEAPAGSRSRGENRQTEVAAMSRRLKRASRELGAPVIALSQLNRALESRHDKRPTLADLRESGAIEQDADVVILLHVDEDDPHTLHVFVAKNRHGETGSLELNREGAFARVTSRAWSPTARIADPAPTGWGGHHDH